MPLLNESAITPSVPISAVVGRGYCFISEILEGSVIDMSNGLINFSEPELFHILSDPTFILWQTSASPCEIP